MRTWHPAELVLLGVVGAGVLFIVVDQVERAFEDAREAERLESIDKREEMERERRAQEYEDRTAEPCGPLVEMLGELGDVRSACTRDVDDLRRQGWIVRDPDWTPGPRDAR
jgi:hypothetical protein